MNAAEAGAVEYEEPDWLARFQEHCDEFDEPDAALREDEAFARTLKDYRRFHFTWLDDGKRRPLDAPSAVIGLAKLRIFPPRSRTKYLSRTNNLYEPDIGDDHMWLTIKDRAWRIEAIDSRTLFLDSYGDKMQLDIVKAPWHIYVEKALEILRAAWG